MKRDEKLFYEAPSTMVLDVKQEGAVCTSTQGVKSQDYTYGNLDEA